MIVNRGSWLALVVACTAQTKRPAPLDHALALPARARPHGLELYLSPGRAAAPEDARVQVVAGRKLGADEVAALIAGGTPFPADPEPKFAFRDKAPPVPSGATTARAFPPPASAAAPVTTKAVGSALHVVHWQPAPELAVMFDQPMPAAVPVVLTPQPPGEWHWIGTRTLVFEPEHAWPQATSFRAEIAAGTKSAGGGALHDAASFAFETGAPRVVGQYPAANEPGRGDAMALVFDQRIDPAAMAPHVHVTAAGHSIEIALVDTHDVTDPRLAAFVAAAERDGQAGHYLVVRAKSPLPRDAEIAIEIAAGAPSAEGPLRTPDAQHVALRTAGMAAEPAARAPAPVEPIAFAGGEPAKLAWYVVTDRDRYRPGEVVHVKGWLRKLDGGLAPLGDAVTAVTCRAFDARGSQVASGVSQIDPSGGFDEVLPLARSPQSGPARIVIETSGKTKATYTHALTFDEPGSSEIVVSAHANDGPFVAGGAAELGASATYAAGGPVAAAPMQWYVTAEPAPFAPPGRDDYVFGGGPAGEPQEWMLAGTTDASGTHALHLDFLSIDSGTPMRVIARASVTGASRQTWTASVPLIVHAAQTYVGLRTQRRFAERGQPIAIDAVAVDLDGKPVRDAKIVVVAQSGDDEQACTLAGEGTCRFVTTHGGAYRIVATVADDRGRTNRTELEVPVAGGPPRDTLALVADRSEYAPGDTAELLVEAPFLPATGTVTWRRGASVHVDKLAMATASTVLRVPIGESFVPETDVEVELTGAGRRASASLALAGPPRRRALAVHVAPSAPVLGLGEHARVAIDVRDAAGRAVGDAQLAVIAVDEAVLAGDPYPDPFDVFYPRRAMRARDVPARSAVESANPLAAFVPSVKTDAEGHAVVDVQMPGDPGRYRVVALAAAGATQFGKGESTVVARWPLAARARPPKFLNAGDRFALPVVVQNETEAPLTVQLAVQATNAQFTDGRGREVTVPANGRVEVDFPAQTDRPGTAHFQMFASVPVVARAVHVPVRVPATAQTVALYGTLDRGAVRVPIALPANSAPRFGGLEIETASTNLQSLTDALLAVVHDPHDGAEPRAARIAATMALVNVLEQFHIKDMPSPAELFKHANADGAQLAQLQNSDGGFASWQRGGASDPLVTGFVAYALSIARGRVHVDQQVIERAQDYLRRVEAYVPASYSDDARATASAFALYLRRRSGDVDVSKAKQVYADVGAPDHASLWTDGLLLATLAGRADAVDERKALLARVVAHEAEADDRTRAVLLEALATEAPNHELIPKLVAALLAHRTNGRWSSPQDNAFAIAALSAYFFGHDTTEPNFRARVWLGKDFAGDHAFVGKQNDRFEVDIPMAQLAPADLVIQNDGTGHLYYRVAMTYADADPKLAPIEHGFVVRRRYEAIDDPRDVTRAADGAWHVRAGARVRVYVAVANDDPRAQVALDDPLPAGFEPIAAAVDPWIEHQELRDDGVQAYATQLPTGVHVLAYVARAATPGEFHAPPPRVEALYQPESFGRGERDRVIVETMP